MEWYSWYSSGQNLPSLSETEKKESVTEYYEYLAQFALPVIKAIAHPGWCKNSRADDADDLFGN